MHKLRVGIIIDFTLLPASGGTYSYYQTMLHGINSASFNEAIEFVNVVFYQKNKPQVSFKKPVVFIKSFIGKAIHDSKEPSFLQTLSKYYKYLIRKTPVVQNVHAAIQKIHYQRIEHQLAANNLDLIYYLKPEDHFLNYPFIMTHWDTGHRSTYPFPELAMNGNYEAREHYYTQTLNKALLILCESDEGAKELMHYYKMNAEKVKVLPIFSSRSLDAEPDEEYADNILSSYTLKTGNFFIYPAQFWSYKNHYNLVVAFGLFIQNSNFKDYKLVLCGSDKGNLKYIREIIQELSLAESVIITGFVKNSVLSSFYDHASALVMPTFLGPTNMPLIEAAERRCPVLCSRLKGHYEIMETYAAYFDPADANDIKVSMENIAYSSTDRTAITEAAYVHIKQSKFNLNKSLILLNNILMQIISVRKTWGRKITLIDI